MSASMSLVFALLARCVLARLGSLVCCCAVGTEPCPAALSAYLGSTDQGQGLAPGLCGHAVTASTASQGMLGLVAVGLVAHSPTKPPGCLLSSPWAGSSWVDSLCILQQTPRALPCLGFGFGRTGRSHPYFPAVPTAFLYSL